MSVASEIERISENIAEAYSTAEGMGATMPEIQNSDNLASTISTISTGSGGVSSVNGKTGIVTLSAADVGAIANEESAVTAELIANYNVTTEKLADKAVTSEKLADGAVTPASINAVNKAGDTMTGDLTVQKESFPKILVESTNHNADGGLEKGTHNITLMARNVAGDSDNYRALIVNDSQNSSPALFQAVRLNDRQNGTSKYYDIFGQHNKPTGSYTGNGSATSRTISVGGVGRAVLITSTNGAAMLTTTGGFAFDADGVRTITYANAYLSGSGGGIILKTTLAALNANGVSYTYQLL